VHWSFAWRGNLLKQRDRGFVEENVIEILGLLV